MSGARHASQQHTARASCLRPAHQQSKLQMLLCTQTGRQTAVPQLERGVCGAEIYTAVATSDPVFVSGCEGGGGPTEVDLRCQGTPSDVCGCVQVAAISETPYYGCVMSGYSAEDSLPLVTLPGVVEGLPQPACDAADRVKRFIPSSALPPTSSAPCLWHNQAMPVPRALRASNHVSTLMLPCLKVWC